MKYFSLILFLAVLHAKCISQSQSSGFSSAGSPAQLSGGMSMPTNMIDPAWRSATLDAGANWNTFNGVKGNAFYNDNWHKGYIVLQGNKVVRDVLLNFNIYANQIFYMYDSQAFVLDESAPVSEFGTCKREDSSVITIFRCGFPPIASNSSKTFYEVIVNDKIALLRRYSKSIVQNINSFTGATDQQFFEKETWYVYDEFKHKMAAIRKNRKSVEGEFPEYAAIIESIIQQQKLKLKTDDDWKILFDELNKRVK